MRNSTSSDTPGRTEQAIRFQTLLEPHLKQLWSTAYRFTGHREDAEDLLQELLTRLYPQHQRLLAVEQLLPWLIRSLYYVHVDRRRSFRRSALSRADSPADESEWESIESSAPGPEQLAEADSERRQLFAALSALDPDQRAVVVLHDMEGHTLSQLETQLDVPIGTLKSRLFRARRKLRGIVIGNLSAQADELVS